tara:strand:+ start:367 stop:561 length:195 start_codon:yes stop_codon:yes gene_type:complete
MWNKYKRQCRICKKSIKVTEKRIGSNRFSHCSTELESEEGVHFVAETNPTHVWFCNECWEEVRK